MPVDFDWNFADEPRPTLPEPPRRSIRWRRFTRRGLIVLLLLGTLGLLVRGWIQSRLDRIKEVESDLRLTVQVELQAQAEGDLELFLALQDPNDPNWRRLQTTFFYANHTPSPNFFLADRPIEIGQVRVSGRQGQIEITHWFTSVPTGPNITEGQTYPFQTTWFYRLANDGNWQHVAPPNDYLGESWVWDGVWLDVTSRGVDADLIAPLSGEFIRLVSQSCGWIQCAANRRYTLTFGNTLSPRMLPNQWSLPAPYLIGQPADESTRTVWQNSLKRTVVLALVDANVDRARIERRAFYPHLLAWLTAELELTEPESPDTALLASAWQNNAWLAPSDLWGYERANTPTDQNELIDSEIILLIQVIGSRYGPSAVGAMISALEENRPFNDLLNDQLGIDPADLEAAWLNRLQEIAHASP